MRNFIQVFFSLAFFLCAFSASAQFTATCDTVCTSTCSNTCVCTCVCICTNNDCCTPLSCNQSIVSTNFPPGWSCTLCNPNGCFGTGTTSSTFSIAASAIAQFNFNINIGNQPGNGIAVVRVTDANNTNNFQEFELSISASAATGIDDIEINEITALTQNYPNPVKESTTIDFKLESSDGQLIISDLTGRVLEVKQLNTAEGQVVLDNFTASGVYFYTLIDADKVIDRKHLLVIK